jgi:hypothetical protein
MLVTILHSINNNPTQCYHKEIKINNNPTQCYQKEIKINNNPTQCYQKEIKQTLMQCVNIIQKEHIWKYTNMNPMAPCMHATIKLHKPNTPIRPIINWKNAPAYEIAKKLSKTLHNYLNLPYTYNV